MQSSRVAPMGRMAERNASACDRVIKLFQFENFSGQYPAPSSFCTMAGGCQKHLDLGTNKGWSGGAVERSAQTAGGRGASQKPRLFVEHVWHSLSSCGELIETSNCTRDAMVESRGSDI